MPPVKPIELVSGIDGFISEASSPSVSATIIAIEVRLPPISTEPSLRLMVPLSLTEMAAEDMPPPLNQKPPATPRPR